METRGEVTVFTQDSVSCQGSASRLVYLLSPEAMVPTGTSSKISETSLFFMWMVACSSMH